jgi:hypothetical protein
MSIPNYSQVVRTTGGVEVKRAAISGNSNAAVGNELVAAVADRKICVLGVSLIAAGAVNATFYSDAANAAGATALSGAMPLAANGGFVVNPPADPQMHWLETAAGKALTLLLSAGVQVSGFLTYYEG